MVQIIKFLHLFWDVEYLCMLSVVVSCQHLTGTLDVLSIKENEISLLYAIIQRYELTLL